MSFTLEEQKQRLNEALQEVERQSFLMKRALDNNDLREALTFCANMVSELRTGALSPKIYDELYHAVFIQLRILQIHIEQKIKEPAKLNALYEFVQFAGNILPRLYLLVTVGAVYITARSMPAKLILSDIVEMCRGVQHPIRGLFLRNYLIEMTKDKLPDEGTVYFGEGGDVTNAIDFIIDNFTEMNKLWVRMQIGAHTSKSKIEQERKDIGLLVGKNLSQLGLLEGLTFGLYQSDVLPRVMKQIINCEDHITQQFLLDIVIQTFVDEFHVKTLNRLLDDVLNLHPKVNIQEIGISLLEKVSNYLEQNPGSAPEDIDVFQIYNEFIDACIEDRPDETVENLKLINAFLNEVFELYNGDLEKVDIVLKKASDAVKICSDKDTTNALLEVLSIPMKKYDNFLTTLDLKNYSNASSKLPFNSRKTLAIDIGHTLLAKQIDIDNIDHVEALLSLLEPLIVGDSSETEIYDDELDSELSILGSVISLINNEDFTEMILLLNKCKEHFSKGPNDRLKYTLIPLVFRALQITQRMYTGEKGDETVKKAIQFARDSIQVIDESGKSTMAFKLYLQCAAAIGMCGAGTTTYKFITKAAFPILNQKVTKDQERYECIILVIGLITALDCFTDEQYKELVKETTIAARSITDEVQHNAIMFLLEKKCGLQL